ncbi:hypothetical protein CORC01_06469 [Colletotrichum orchidophilum]|uniref:Uncharacterized protein n=1 Tax=Colletotrichum orchidophilum TaxID=1209926 RepID=A0A1G4BAF3_9PEZI|nr:uncharacterized protein CORC01_06469 [Colletotrichum orchidophilum]OHE98272.1 hypothetical protein CORC01_06469 [Colletotrichum orchidophilum]
MGWYNITDDYIKDAKINLPVCEILEVRERCGGTQRTIDRIDQTGQPIPVWTLNENNEEGVLAILYANPKSQAPPNSAVGIIKYHTLSSKAQITLRGTDLSMKLTDYSHGHEFNFNGCKYRWIMSKNTMSTSTLYLKDGSERTLARWRRKPEGRGGDSSPIFELFVPPQALDMDFFIVTGLACAGYWRKANKDSFKIIGKLLGGIDM